MQEIRVWSLGLEDPLEKEMVTHSCILAWKILWTEEPGGLHGITRVRHDLATKQQEISVGGSGVGGVWEICFFWTLQVSPAFREVVINVDIGLLVQNPVQKLAGDSNWSKLTDRKVVSFNVFERIFFFAVLSWTKRHVAPVAGDSHLTKVRVISHRMKAVCIC